MKKSVPLANLPAIISALKCELEDPRLDSLIEKPSLEMDELMEDVHIFSFLSVPEARNAPSWLVSVRIFGISFPPPKRCNCGLNGYGIAGPLFLW
jgi:hypothetical protein